MNAPVRINPYLSGNFGPVRSEDDLPDLPLSGEIPAALNGTFYRNGPNPQFPPRDPDHHWFAGDGMLHSFILRDGQVGYKNRYVRTQKWELENAAGKALFGTFGNPMTTDPAVLGKDGGVANTNVIWHAGKLLALEEGHQPFEVDPATLMPRGYVPYAGSAGRFTAHPKMDPETGEMVFFGYGVGEMPLSAGMAFGTVDRNGKIYASGPFPGALFEHGPRLSGDQELRAFSHPASVRQPPTCHERQARIRLGTGTGKPYRSARPQCRHRHHALVHCRSLLRFPPHECVGGRRQDFRRRHAI